MANRHGNVDLRLAQVSALVRTLVWLALAALLRVGKAVGGEQQRSKLQRPVSKQVFFVSNLRMDTRINSKIAKPNKLLHNSKM